MFYTALDTVPSNSERMSLLSILPDPYYSYEDVVRARYNLHANQDSTNLQEETFAGFSYTAELLLHLVAKSMFKWPCKNNWPRFNRLGHKRFVPNSKWQYGLLECEEGVEETRQYPPEYTWENLCKDASHNACDYLPEELAARPHLLLLWIIIVPYRLTPEVGKLLSARLPTF